MNYLKTILVTGGAGFIGSNYLNTLVPRYPNYRFINLDAITYAGNKKNITVEDSTNYTFIKGNICDEKKLEKIFDKYKIDHVIHFAAESHVDISIKDPNIFVETNIKGTHNLLHQSLKHKTRRFHQISTDEVYGSLALNEASFTEGNALLPNNPYSASKASADLLVRAYNKTFGLDTVITRCSNNFGPNQDETKLIPLFIKKLLAKEKVPLYAKGENMRDWLYVEDHIKAIDLVFHEGKSGEIYNIGGGKEMRNIDVVRKLIKLSGRDENAIEEVSDRIGHDFRYAIDSSKIKKELGWKIEKDFDQALDETFQFFFKRRPLL